MKPNRGGWCPACVVPALVAAVLVAVVHWPVLSAGAVSLDDGPYLFDNPLLMNPSWEGVRVAFGEVLEPSTVEGYYEPLTLVSLMLDVLRGGRPGDLRPFHVTNLLLHVLNTACVIVLLHALLARRAAEGRAGRWVPFAAGLVYGLHPLSVEPVAWVWERKTMLATLFGLASLIAYARYAERGGRARYAAALLFFVMGLLSKPTITPLPVLLLLLDFWPLGRLSRRAIAEKVPFLLIAGVSAVVTIVSTSRAAVVSLPAGHGPGQALVRGGYLLAFYLGKIVWPAGLSSVYVLPEPFSLARPAVLAGVVATCGLAVAVLVSLRWSRSAFVGAAFFAIAILPTLGLIRYSWVAASDKYVYFPAVGLVLLGAWWGGLWWEASGRSSRRTALRGATAAAVLAILCAEAVATRLYLREWRDTETLCRYMLDLAPRSAVLHNHLGSELLRKEKGAGATAHFQKAIEIEPGYADAHYNLGFDLLNRGDVGGARDCFETAVRLRPRHPEALNNLGIALAREGRLDEAIDRFQKALEIRSRYPEAHSNLALALVKRGRLDEAVGHYRTAIRLKPESVLPRRNLVIALVRLGRSEEAIAECQGALRIEPNDADLRCDLGDLFKATNRREAAAAAYWAALQARPDSGRAQAALRSLVGASLPSPAR